MTVRTLLKMGDPRLLQPAAAVTAFGTPELEALIADMFDIMAVSGGVGLAGLIAGGPTFVGAMVGYNVTSEPLELLFYAVAGGAILYVIGEIWTGMRRYGHRELGLLLLAAGFTAGVVTDLVVVYGGG